MQFGHAPRTEKEKAFALVAYNIGMKNPWASGRAAIEDGDFIVEDDRLNKKNWAVIDSLSELKAFFKHGNWTLGTGVIYKSLAFIEQTEGGSEWLTIKRWPDGEAFSFDSVSFRLIILNGKDKFENYIHRLLKATKKQARTVTY